MCSLDARSYIDYTGYIDLNRSEFYLNGILTLA